MTTAAPSRRWTYWRRGSARSLAAASAKSGSRCWTRAWPSAASTRSTTPGTAICAATARCRMPASASASSAPSPTSRASPTSATRSPSRAPPATHGINGSDLGYGAAPNYDGRQNNNRRRDFDREADEQRRRVGPLRALQLSNQGWSEGEAELIDCHNEADDPGEMVLRELLLNDEARQRGRIPNTRPDQQA